MKKIVLLLLLLIIGVVRAQRADLIIFSFDRPLQLYAFLESAERYITNIGDIHVIYRASSAGYARAYDQIFNHFSLAVPIKQGDQPKADFKPLTLKSFNATQHPYILFAVDDIIVTDYIDLAECIQALEKADAYGFYLRLGKNISYAYMLNKSQQVPSLYEVSNGVYSWIFAEAQYDWAYPHTVDMALYRKKDIKNDLEQISYQAPNTLEAKWSRTAQKIMQKQGLCYAHSKIVNVPLNRIQTEFLNNRNEQAISPEELLKLFERGLKIDINPLYRVNNQSPHMPYIPNFVMHDGG